MTAREIQLEAALRVNAALRVRAERLIAAYVVCAPEELVIICRGSKH
jgi:hypothetical protein